MSTRRSTSWPERLRRVIMLAAAGRNVRGGTWWQDVSAGVDGRDGAGAVDVSAGVAIVLQRRRRKLPASARRLERRNVVIVCDRLSGIGDLQVHIDVPPAAVRATRESSRWPATARSRSLELAVVLRLTARSRPQRAEATASTVGSSASWDNSYEIVESAAKAGQMHEIVIRRWSGIDDVWFGRGADSQRGSVSA